MSLNIITVTLNLDTMFLGISTVGQYNKEGDKGIYVNHIVKGGPVDLDGRIEPGDRILQVNDINFENMSNDDAVRVLREAVQKPGSNELTAVRFAKIMKSTITIPATPAPDKQRTSLCNRIGPQIYSLFRSYLLLYLMLWSSIISYTISGSCVYNESRYNLVNCSSITLERTEYELYQNGSTYINTCNQTLNDTFYNIENNNTLTVCKQLSDAERESFRSDITHYDFPKQTVIGYIKYFCLILSYFLLMVFTPIMIFMALFMVRDNVIITNLFVLTIVGATMLSWLRIILYVHPASNSICNLDIFYRIPALNYFFEWTAITWVSMMSAEVFMIGYKMLSQEVFSKYVKLKSFMVVTFFIMMQLMFTKIVISHAAYLSRELLVPDILPFKDDLYLISTKRHPLFYLLHFAWLALINIGTHDLGNVIFAPSTCSSSKKMKEVRRQLRVDYLKLFVMSIFIYIIFVVGNMYKISNTLFIYMLFIILHMWWEISSFFNVALITLREVSLEIGTGSENEYSLHTIPEKDHSIKAGK